MDLNRVNLINKYTTQNQQGAASALPLHQEERDFESTLAKVMMMNRLSAASAGSGIHGTGSAGKTGITTSAELEAIFKKAADTYDVPEELLKAMAKAESGFNPDAVSKCGAQGIMQLMPATARALGVTDPFDPEQNIMGGAKYISDKIKAYDGDITLALAAYNAGPGNVAKYGGVPPFAETQNYIKKIYGYMGEDIQLPDSISSGGLAGRSNLLAEYGIAGLPADSEEAKNQLLLQLQLMRQQMELQAMAIAKAGSDYEDEDLNSLDLNMLIDSLNSL